jgi:hypothetical protein
VVYQQIPVWVTPAESRQLAVAVTDLLRPLRARTGGRRQRRTTFAMVLHPDPTGAEKEVARSESR